MGVLVFASSSFGGHVGWTVVEFVCGCEVGSGRTQRVPGGAVYVLGTLGRLVWGLEGGGLDGEIPIIPVSMLLWFVCAPV